MIEESLRRVAGSLGIIIPTDEEIERLRAGNADEGRVEGRSLRSGRMGVPNHWVTARAVDAQSGFRPRRQKV